MENFIRYKRKLLMGNLFTYIINIVAGKPKLSSLENRLFSSLALLNGASNTLGSINYLSEAIEGNFNSIFLFFLHLGSGLLLLFMYLFSRFRGKYRSLFWPFILSIYLFLFVNILFNAGSLGGAHYYLISATLIGVILAPSKLTTALCFLLGMGISVVLFQIEENYSEWIIFFTTPEERFADVPGQFYFTLILNGLLLFILRLHFNEEREKSESLLLNILPKAIAEELKASEKVEPILYDEASVLFTDFVGFTRFAEKLDPQNLIEKLDDNFRAFDNIVFKYRLEKIKTIGDAYMAVGGLPKVNNTHHLDAVLAGLEMQEYIHIQSKANQGNNEIWQLRVGIHTGNIVAGVIGERKFAYDIWGDTVNIASRMESSSEPSKVNISHTVHEKIQEFFQCTERGEIAAKNKGKISMFFVERLLPVYSQDLKGFTPNQTFWEKYRELKNKET